MRDLTSGMQTEVSATNTAPIFLVECDFSSGFVRVWSGLGDLLWNAQTWIGVGSLGGISPLSESTDFNANGAKIQLSGIPSDLLAIAQAQQYQGRAANIYLGMLNSSGVVIADPIKLFAAKMDTMEILEGAETSTITLNIESRAITLKRSHERRYTHEDQQIDFPGDRGFEYVAGLQDKEIIWKPA